MGKSGSTMPKPSRSMNTVRKMTSREAFRGASDIDRSVDVFGDWLECDCKSADYSNPLPTMLSGANSLSGDKAAGYVRLDGCRAGRGAADPLSFETCSP